jgi:hypothetical protein
MKSSLLVSGVLLFAAANSSLHAGTAVTYDFNGGAGDPFLADFHRAGGTSDIPMSSSGGLGDGGMFNTRSGSGSQLWVTKAAYAPLSNNQTLSISAFFKFSATTATSSIKIGYTDTATPTAKPNAYPLNGSMAYFSEIPNLSDSSLAIPECYGRNNTVGGNYITTSMSDAVSLTTGSWYKITFSLTKTAAGTFDTTCALYNSSDTGVVGSAVKTFSATGYSNAGLDTTLYAFVGFENPGSTCDFYAIDNITLASDAAITGSSVPEPSAVAFCAGAGALALALAARRRTTRKS